MCRVMLIDDDPAILRALECLLEVWGCEVVPVSSTKEAVANVSGGVDAIVADYRLRDSDNGITAIRAVQAATGEAVPAVIITGDIAVDRLQNLHQSGLPVRHKPIKADDLFQVLSGFLADKCAEFRTPTGTWRQRSAAR